MDEDALPISADRKIERILRARWSNGCPKCRFVQTRADTFTESICNGKQKTTYACPACGVKESTE